MDPHETGMFSIEEGFEVFREFSELERKLHQEEIISLDNSLTAGNSKSLNVSSSSTAEIYVANTIPKNVIVFAMSNKIFVLDYDGAEYQIAERGGVVLALCSHAGRLHDSSAYMFGSGIFDTITNKEIAKRGLNRTLAMCSHDGKFYEAGEYKKVIEYETGKIIAERSGHILALCSHEGLLYDAGRNSGVYETVSNKEVIKRRPSDTLCSHNKKLHFSQGSKIYSVMKIKENLIPKERRIVRDGLVTALLSHEGELYDGGQYRCLHETLTGKRMLENCRVQVMCSHPRDFFAEHGIFESSTRTAASDFGKQLAKDVFFSGSY